MFRKAVQEGETGLNNYFQQFSSVMESAVKTDLDAALSLIFKFFGQRIF